MNANLIKRVATLIVTYNRLEELKKCLEAVRNQTYTDLDIIVVNNGSTDGTKEFLSCQTDIISINQNNLGGAGGFYTGMKYAYEKHYAWLWMMDDDGIPHPDELNELLNSYNEIASKEKKDVILNALVADKMNKEQTAFLWGRGSKRSTIINELQKEPFIKDIHPFNGTLIKWEIIHKIGFIKKEMFIWGDEEEYIARAQFNGINSYTVTKAIHYHPKEKGKKGYLLPFTKKYYILVKPTNMSHYYYRNKGYIYNTYPQKKKHILPFILANTIYNLTRGKINELVKFYRFFIKGKNNNYSIS